MYKDRYILKPWGWEYLVYENKDVALWFLHLEPNESTSMHCHSNKTTGLVLLQGSAKMKFLADEQMIHAPHKQMIRRGLFHSTQALEEGATLLELETPNDKTDLIRLNDAYGRQNTGYELQDKMLPKLKEMLWINEDGEFFGKFDGCELSVVNLYSTKAQVLLTDDIYLILQGYVYKTIEGVDRNMLIPGDVGLGGIMNIVLKEASGCSQDTLLLRVRHDSQ